MVTFDPAHWVFVFGSNLAGKHGKGAALDAASLYGAERGVGEGLRGRSYAIPTKSKDMKTLPLDVIRENVMRFLRFAEIRPEMTFQVTRIGCGLAGYQDTDIAPMFEDAPTNVHLPRKWYLELGKVRPEFRVIVAGAHDAHCFDTVERKLDSLLVNVKVPIRLVTGDGSGIDELAERYAEKHDLNLARFVANTDLFKDRAEHVRSHSMAWYSDAAVVFRQENESDGQDVLTIAKAENLPVREHRLL